MNIRKWNIKELACYKSIAIKLLKGKNKSGLIENDIEEDYEKNNLYNELNKNDCLKYEYYDLKECIVPSEKLGEGWNWRKCEDGSGCLVSPDGKEYMFYDLDTNEYRVTRDECYQFFPLKYYYVDGIEPSDFDAFEYMEQDMIDRGLFKENDEISI